MPKNMADHEEEEFEVIELVNFLVKDHNRKEDQCWPCNIAKNFESQPKEVADMPHTCARAEEQQHQVQDQIQYLWQDQKQPVMAPPIPPLPPHFKTRTVPGKVSLGGQALKEAIKEALLTKFAKFAPNTSGAVGPETRCVIFEFGDLLAMS